MLSSLISFGAKYVPSILSTIGTGLGKLIGGSSAIKTIGSKLRNNVVGKELLNIVGQTTKALISPDRNDQQRLAIEAEPLENQVAVIGDSEEYQDDIPTNRNRVTTTRKKIRKRRPRYLKRK